MVLPLGKKAIGWRRHSVWIRGGTGSPEHDGDKGMWRTELAPLGSCFSRQAMIRGIWLPWQSDLVGRDGADACLCPKGKSDTNLVVYLEWNDL